MKTNKEQILERYESICNSKLPGKGAAAVRIVAASWDTQADSFVNQGRLDSMGYKIDDNLTMNCVKGIVQRNPEINEQLKALKS